jgi:NAD(P)-dependent dehydrogenase (short-subunit alcohol dehydrogenase family)
MSDQPLKDNIAVVTGASRGLGRETALQLAAKGAHIIAIARTVGALEELDDDIQAAGGNATLVPFDLTKLADIDALGPMLHSKFGRCDIFVGNAGILGELCPTAQYDPKLWAEVFTINVHANQRFIATLDPLLRNAPNGRAVFLTSGAAKSCKAYWNGYAASKAALEAMCQSYADEVAQSNLKVNIFDPGRTRTAMRAKAYPGENPETLPDVASVAAQLVPLCLPDYSQTGARIAA